MSQPDHSPHENEIAAAGALKAAPRDSERAFPTRLVACAMILTLGFVLWVGGNGLYLYRLLTHDVADAAKINETGNEILSLENVLAQAAKLADDSGDIKWERRFEDHAAVLRAKIDRVAAEMPGAEMRALVADVTATNLKIKELEVRSFAMVRRGDLLQASEILDGEDYVRLTRAYNAKMQALTEKIRHTLYEQTSLLARNMYYALYLIALALALLSFTWYKALHNIGRWRAELEAARKVLAQRVAEKEQMEKQLQRWIVDVETSQAEAVKARVAAEQANEAKSDFLANMSHEIRTPMNGVLGMTQLLLDTELDAQQRGWGEIIRRSGENLLAIINDILDFSKIEAGRMSLEPIPCDLQAAVTDVTDVLALRTQEKGIELAVQFMPGTPRHVVADPMRFKQVLLNLAGNAIKFTQQGHVLIRLTGDMAGAGHIALRVEVEDTGIGIPAGKLDRIFEKFSQAEELTTRRFGGTGLGLTISQKLVGMMGGKIVARSEPGKGSVFAFDITLPAGQAEPAEPLPPVELKGRRVLVADAYALSRDILITTLAAWGMRCEGCAHLGEAESLVQEAAANDPYHFVILDHRPGSGNALDLAAQWQSWLPQARPCVLLLAAIGQLPAAPALLACGVAAALTKPCAPDQLAAALKLGWHGRGAVPALVTRHSIRQYLRARRAQSETDITSFTGLKVLVVDDVKVNQLLLAKILEKMGCIATLAAHGREAVEKLRAAPFDLVFMDCQMPEMDGFAATRQIRADEAANNAPPVRIVALTADAMVGDREKCLAAGMDDYLNKPFKPQQIADMLAKWARV